MQGVSYDRFAMYEHVRNVIWGSTVSRTVSASEIERAVVAWAHRAPPEQLYALRDMGYVLVRYYTERRMGRVAAARSRSPSPVLDASHEPAEGVSSAILGSL